MENIISFKKAAIYNAISKYGTMLVQLGLTMILSRLIVPEAYGIIAIITVLLGFFQLFADMGLGVNIIQHPELPVQEIEKLFSFSCILGLVLSLLALFSSYPLAFFYSDSTYKSVCPLIAIVCFFNSINVIPNAILTRDKRFDLIAKRSIMCALISGLVAVILALLNLGVYALVIQSIFSSIFFFIWNYIHNPLHLKKFELSQVMSILGSYSLYQIMFNFLNYFTRNLDNLFIGRKFGSANLAYYNKSYYLYLYPNNIFASVITGVLHPYIREYKNNYVPLLEKYYRIEKYLSLIGAFTMASFFVCSNEIILIMFGDSWKPACLCLKCLSICMWSQMMSAVSGSIFLGIERTDQLFKCGIINFLMIVFSIIVGVIFNSIYILSLFIGISYNLIFVITNFILLNRTMKSSIWSLFSKISYDGLFSFFVCGLSLLVCLEAPNMWVSLIIKMIFVIILYLIYLIFSGQFKYLIKIYSIISN